VRTEQAKGSERTGLVIVTGRALQALNLMNMLMTVEEGRRRAEYEGRGRGGFWMVLVGCLQKFLEHAFSRRCYLQRVFGCLAQAPDDGIVEVVSIFPVVAHY